MPIYVLIDTGASRTVLRRREYEKLRIITGRQAVLEKSEELCGVTGHEIAVMGKTEIEEVLF
jgi:predicted aspartyl protease